MNGEIKECMGRRIFHASNPTNPAVFLSPGGELFMQLEKEGIFMEDTAW